MTNDWVAEAFPGDGLQVVLGGIAWPGAAGGARSVGYEAKNQLASGY
jgi:hypothetical protein